MSWTWPSLLTRAKKRRQLSGGMYHVGKGLGRCRCELLCRGIVVCSCTKAWCVFFVGYQVAVVPLIGRGGRICTLAALEVYVRPCCEIYLIGEHVDDRGIGVAKRLIRSRSQDVLVARHAVQSVCVSGGRHGAFLRDGAVAFPRERRLVVPRDHLCSKVGGAGIRSSTTKS